MTETRMQATLRLIHEQGVLRSKDLMAHNIPRQYLCYLLNQGLIRRTARGLYIAMDAKITEHHLVAEVTKRVPSGTVCLLSALQFHKIVASSSDEVWMAVDGKTWRPRVSDLPIHFVRFSGDALTYGIEIHDVEGVGVNVYSAAKTVADCFKYRNKIGIDLAVEALRSCRRRKKATVDEILSAANACRVGNVIRPYMAAIL